MKSARIREGTIISTYNTKVHERMTLEQMRASGLGIPLWILGFMYNKTLAIWNYGLDFEEFIQRVTKNI